MSKKIGIIADTTADLPNGMAEKKDINLIPITIFINDKPKLHGKDIINQEVVEHLAQKDDVATEPPTPRTYSSIFKKLSEQYDQIYSLHASSDLSKCYANAEHGLKLFKKKQKAEEKGIIINNNINIIDTRAAGISQGQIVSRIASIVKNDYDQVKLDKYMAWLIKKTTMFFVVDDLYWIKKAGQLNTVSTFFGKMLDIKPVVKLEDGKLIPVDKPKGKDIAIDSMIRMVVKEALQHKRGVEIWVAHSVSLLDAKYVRKQLAEKCKIEEKRIPIVEAGPTIVAHTGPGVVSVSILPK